MIYQWKIPSMPVDADSAGNELERICKKNNGNLLAKDVVEESRPETAVLHKCFEWDDAVAAERFREVQAGKIIRNITIVHREEGGKPTEVRAFVSIQKSYQQIHVVMSDTDKKAELLASALRDLMAFQQKYRSLSELSPVFDAISVVSLTA